MNYYYYYHHFFLLIANLDQYNIIIFKMVLSKTALSADQHRCIAIRHAHYLILTYNIFFHARYYYLNNTIVYLIFYN